MVASACPLLELPHELLQLVAAFAFANDTGFAFASRKTMDVTARPLGLDSIFAICVHAALERIARQDATPHARLFDRLRLVERAMTAGNDVELFIWPPEAIDGPLPSPLRARPWDGSHPEHTIWEPPKLKQYSFPIEHNFQVSHSHPDPTGEFVGRHSLDSLSVTTRKGYFVDLLRNYYHCEPLEDVLDTVCLCFGNDHHVDVHGTNVKTYKLKNANVRRPAYKWLSKGSLRRYAFQLKPNAF